MKRRALLLTLLLPIACTEPAPPPPPPGAVEKTLNTLAAREEAQKEQAVAVSRAREDQRLEAAEERLEKTAR